MILNGWLINATLYIFFHEYSNLNVFQLQLLLNRFLSMISRMADILRNSSQFGLEELNSS